MMETLIVVTATAVLSSVLTLLLAYLFYRKRIEPALEARMGRVQDEFEQRVQRGVSNAGQELLPAFRQEVANGFRDALQGITADRLGEGTARAMSRGADLFEKGLRGLFGVPPNDR